MHPRHHLVFISLPEVFAVCKLAAEAPIPDWALSGHIFSVTRTTDELSIVCEQNKVPDGIQCERGWKCLRVAGTMSFSLVGVVASISVPLANAGIGIFVISTFDTDYLLVKEVDLQRAIDALQASGHSVSN